MLVSLECVLQCKRGRQYLAALSCSRCCCSMNTRILPLAFSKKTEECGCISVCVYVCVCDVRGGEAGVGVKALVGKQTKTRSGHTPVSGCMPSASPQTTTYAFYTLTAQHTHANTQSAPAADPHWYAPKSPNHLLYCYTRSPEITSQSKIICYYCPAAPWHCAINKAIVEGALCLDTV